MGREQEKPRARRAVWAVWADRVVYAAILVVIVMPGGALEHWPVAKWRWLEDADVWPTIARRDLHVMLDPPGGFAAVARLELTDVHDDTFLLLLNEGLDVETVGAWDAAGDSLGADVTHLSGTFERYHREARALRIDLDELPADGRFTLQLDYAGEAAHGPDGPDWRGLLLVDEHEARMSEQTVFAPQVPRAWQTPGVTGAPGIVSVDAPSAWELFAPGRLTARVAVEREHTEDDITDALFDVRHYELAGYARIPPAGHTLWRWALDRPGTLSLLGGVRRRHESVAGDARLVTLLRDEHAHLAGPFLEEARAALDTYAELWGPAGSGSLGIFEMVCREGHSYNWAGDSVITFDRWALGDDVPLAKLAHEVAHLWWGQRVEGRGDGERVLTEGLAEYAAWRWLAARDTEELRGSVRGAQAARSRLLERGTDAALRDVTFRSSGYNDLAYSKAPLVYRWIESRIGAEAMDAALRAYADEHADTTAVLDDLLDALVVARPGADGPERLRAPWFDHAGDVRVRLDAAEWSPADPAHEAGAGALSLHVEAELVGGAGPEFLLVDVPLGLVGADGERARHVVHLDGERTERSLELPGRPAAVWLDPAGVLPLPGAGLRVFDGPALLSSDPPDDAHVAHGLDEIVLQFDRPVEFVDDLQALRARLREGHEQWVPGLRAVRREDDGRRVVLVTNPLVPDGTYALTLQATFRDARGVPASRERWRLHTEPSDDREPPRVVSTTPRNHGQLAPDVTQVTLTFSETMRTMTGFKKGDIADRLDDHGWQYPEIDMPRWSDAQRTLTVPLAEPLVPGRRYCLPFGSERWVDLSGNGLEPFDFVFTAAGP